MSAEGSLQKVPDRQERPHGGSVLISLLWGLSGVLIGVVLGAAGVGQSVLQQLTPGAHHARELGQLSDRVEDLRQDLAQREKELATERQERKDGIGVLKHALEASERNTFAANMKGELLTRLLAFERSRTEASRGALVDVVCGLRAQDAALRMTFASGPLEIAPEELRSGVRPELERLLIDNGASADLLARARRTVDAAPLPAVTPYNVFEVQRAAQMRRAVMRESHEAIAALQRRARNISVLQTVKFGDGAEHVLPRDVALVIRGRKECGGG